MTRTVEIIGMTESTEADIADGRTTAAAAYEKARELAERAAAHGWDGVAATMQAAVDALQTVSAHLGSVEDATGEVVTGLREITDQTSADDVAAHLTTAGQSLDRVKTAVQAASDGIDDARTACQQAGAPGELLDMLQSLTDITGTVWQGAVSAADAVHAELQATGTWGN